ncbi:MAG TPA: hypothetical protein PKI14_17825 [Fervidobacterium sp.]|nr:hypothetical protein [Fervidobacterium sp.]HUM44808.1 hypothetical protein [Fervidobacterium sp.]
MKRGIYKYIIGGPLLVVHLEVAVLFKAAIIEYRVIFQDTDTTLRFSFRHRDIVMHSSCVPEIKSLVKGNVLYVRGRDESGHYCTDVAVVPRKNRNLVSEVTELVKEFHNKYGYKISVLEIPL